MVNIAKNVLIMQNNLQHMHSKLLQNKQFKKAAEATGNLIGNKIADKIARISKTSPQNILERVINEHNKEKPKQRYTSIEKNPENY